MFLMIYFEEQLKQRIPLLWNAKFQSVWAQRTIFKQKKKRKRKKKKKKNLVFKMLTRQYFKQSYLI